MTVGLNFGPNLADKWVGPMFVLVVRLFYLSRQGKYKVVISDTAKVQDKFLSVL